MIKTTPTLSSVWRGWNEGIQISLIEIYLEFGAWYLVLTSDFLPVVSSAFHLLLKFDLHPTRLTPTNNFPSRLSST